MICLCQLLLLTTLQATTKVHTVTFGKWLTIKWNANPDDDKLVDLKVRPMLVDGKIKEYTIGQPHDVTERLFVVRRAFRINDALPTEPVASPQWRWERGGWLVVDRASARITAITLPFMDASSPDASWYRDYIAYCGISDDGKKVYAVVAQLGRRKPLLRTYLGTAPESGTETACPAPRWERKPARVAFEFPGRDKLLFAVRARTLDTAQEINDDED
jgi:hypothetical protein